MIISFAWTTLAESGTVHEARPYETVSFWMERIFSAALVEAHGSRSPECKPRRMQEVKIPASSKGVGFRPTGEEKS